MTGSEDGMLRVWPLDFSAVFMEAGKTFYTRCFTCTLRRIAHAQNVCSRSISSERSTTLLSRFLALHVHVHVFRSDKMKIVAVGVLASVLCALGCLALDNGLGRTPQMGWNSWNHFHCGINQTVVQETADAFIKHGLDKLGYVCT